LCSSPSPPPSSSPSFPPYYPQKFSSQRRRDPDHVPRPRNSFIIFRCDYARQHCSGNDDQESTDAEKTSLSKRAGEAWKKIPADVKRHYKRLADRERDEHARRNPEYRFRPKRRQSLPHNSRSASKGAAESFEFGEDSRPRSSSLPSLGSSCSSTCSLDSVPVSSSKDHLSCPPGPKTHIATSPELPHTPPDCPTVLSLHLVNDLEQDSFLQAADSILDQTSSVYQVSPRGSFDRGSLQAYY
jgi:HMG (high mobility group) box